ncbi:MAG: hypothetical protein R2939_05110 [Kofleriaceae bacterium]
MLDRGASPAAPARQRFRCLACLTFVHGTERGYCPRCGAAAPSITLARPAAAPRRWTPRQLLVGAGLALVALGQAWLWLRT